MDSTVLQVWNNVLQVWNGASESQTQLKLKLKFGIKIKTEIEIDIKIEVSMPYMTKSQAWPVCVCIKLIIQKKEKKTYWEFWFHTTSEIDHRKWIEPVILSNSHFLWIKWALRCMLLTLPWYCPLMTIKLFPLHSWPRVSMNFTVNCDT